MPSRAFDSPGCDRIDCAAPPSSWDGLSLEADGSSLLALGNPTALGESGRPTVSPHALADRSARGAGGRQSYRCVPRRLRRLASLLILFHVAAVVAAPLSAAPSSRLWEMAWQFGRPYIEFFYLNHGYKFFAPEPGPTTLVAYTLHFADGSTRSGEFPNRSIRPRLLYHRHFMLSEFLNAAPRNWHHTYARHLLRRSGAESVSVSQMTRLLPSMESVRLGSPIDEPGRVVELPLGTYRWHEL